MKEGDLERCAQMSADAWPIAKILVNENELDKLMK